MLYSAVCYCNTSADTAQSQTVPKLYVIQQEGSWYSTCSQHTARARSPTTGTRTGYQVNVLHIFFLFFFLCVFYLQATPCACTCQELGPNSGKWPQACFFFYFFIFSITNCYLHIDYEQKMLHVDEHKDMEGDGNMRTGTGLEMHMCLELLVCFFVLFYKFY